jgi:hypothetical protein
MRINVRKTLIGLFVIGVAGAAVFPFAVYFIGLALAPPRPVPAAIHVPPIVADALWARIDGGRATGMQGLDPLKLLRRAACGIAAEVMTDDRGERQTRDAECMTTILPAMQGAEYVSRVYLQDQDFQPGPKYPFSQIATMTWVTRSWTKSELVDTIAERGKFGFGLRGAEAAAGYYFNRPLAELSVPQAALLAALGIGEKDINPWGEPELAAERRNLVLAKMRDSLAIDANAYEKAMRASLELGPERFGGK